MVNVLNMISVSGGKDSTATLLLALNGCVKNVYPVFADTGNEHEITYQYLEYLENKLSISIRRVKADFSKQIENKRIHTLEKWRLEGVSESIIERASKTLVATGNPFLDLCIWKGRFPSTKARFCTDELKVSPITNEVVFPLLKQYDIIESWQGIRWDESSARSKYVEREGIEPDALRVFAYRPILSWNANDVFNYCAEYDVEPNPLYLQGMGRVGCMPCINARKDEIKNISARFPEVIERIAEWESVVSAASKHQSSTFFAAVNDPTVSKDDEINHVTHGIKRMVEWSNTERGGRLMSLIATDAQQCNSIYGLCE